MMGLGRFTTRERMERALKPNILGGQVRMGRLREEMEVLKQGHSWARTTVWMSLRMGERQVI